MMDGFRLPRGQQPLPVPRKQMDGAAVCPMRCGPIAMVQAMHPNPAILTTQPIKNSFSVCYVCLARWETAPDGAILNLRQPISVRYDPKTGRPVDFPYSALPSQGQNPQKDAKKE